MAVWFSLPLPPPLAGLSPEQLAFLASAMGTRGGRVSSAWDEPWGATPLPSAAVFESRSVSAPLPPNDFGGGSPPLTE